jgi:hypothetical protein
MKRRQKVCVVLHAAVEQATDSAVFWGVTDAMADWDQEKLEEVVKTKHSGQQAKPTDIVCAAVSLASLS